ncbi:pyridoxamine 5'-phosphate oxidase [Agarivorans sp. TSD2052]|uniref:pyridoxamine 5'-phosphate oxidase n=1 Tax=Agarivorans sp. TSD2052 TaxID=2937286 RepID=UPI00200F1A77|nr:pyridoxamine 5'-phosphate oxidase [Agarivorans sp. TSD2052]UPW17383.1 pyridoxamine 5'-phosphate oxidase [Agarivorans sp. TSD2052]
MSLISKLRCALTLGQGVLLSLPEPKGNEDPFTLFGDWFKQAEKSGIVLPESMTISSIGADGRPSARVVLLKDFDEKGFVFYTNYTSRKGQELDLNPVACLTFHWNILQRQVRIEGRVERVSHEESNQYFHTRGRGSQIGAWASQQSQVIAQRSLLEQRVEHYKQKFSNKDVPLPDFWGGYRVIPDSIEFWQGKADRLHDRFRYTCDAKGWKADRLSP